MRQENLKENLEAIQKINHAPKQILSILGLNGESHVNEEVIKKKYRQLALLIHPDKNSDNQKAAEEAFKKLNEEYEYYNNQKDFTYPAREEKQSHNEHNSNSNREFKNEEYDDPYQGPRYENNYDYDEAADEIEVVCVLSMKIFEIKRNFISESVHWRYVVVLTPSNPSLFTKYADSYNSFVSNSHGHFPDLKFHKEIKDAVEQACSYKGAVSILVLEKEFKTQSVAACSILAAYDKYSTQFKKNPDSNLLKSARTEDIDSDIDGKFTDSAYRQSNSSNKQKERSTTSSSDIKQQPESKQQEEKLLAETTRLVHWISKELTRLSKESDKNSRVTPSLFERIFKPAPTFSDDEFKSFEKASSIVFQATIFIPSIKYHKIILVAIYNELKGKKAFNSICEAICKSDREFGLKLFQTEASAQQIFSGK
jgi:curved DNA-binding protein CbpA